MAVVPCTNCGADIDRSPAHLNHSGNNYCNQECYREHRYQDSEQAKSNVWERVREEALERDNHTCQECGASGEQHQQEYYRGLDVHHIKPVATFEQEVDAHTLDNLITLCPSCHQAHEIVSQLFTLREEIQEQVLEIVERECGA